MPAALTNNVNQGPPTPPLDGGWGGDGDPEGRGSSRRAAFTGLLVLLASTAMVFAGFTGAFVMRRGLSGDWATSPKPPILWVNTVVLLASSAALELARRNLKAGNRRRFNGWWTGGCALGVLFLLGQGAAWLQLSRAGIYLARDPSSSFFYVLTAAHAAHLLGGLSTLLYVDVQALRLRLGPSKRTFVDVSALFWHFLDALWLYLMLLLYVWG